MDYKDLANLIFPDVKEIKYIFERTDCNGFNIN